MGGNPGGPEGPAVGPGSSSELRGASLDECALIATLGSCSQSPYCRSTGGSAPVLAVALVQLAAQLGHAGPPIGNSRLLQSLPASNAPFCCAFERQLARARAGIAAAHDDLTRQIAGVGERLPPPPPPLGGAKKAARKQRPAGAGGGDGGQPAPGSPGGAGGQNGGPCSWPLGEQRCSPALPRPAAG